jgi:hypothetical protein
MRTMGKRAFTLLPVSLGALVGLVGTMGCETHIRGTSNGNLVYSDDIPPLVNVPTSLTSVTALQQITDVGGTLAFQKTRVNADEIRIGTSLPHTEVAFFLNDGDPEQVFRNLSSQTNWDSISVADKTIASFGIAPKVTATPSDLSTWTTEGVGGADPNQTGAVALSKQKSGVWRMDHGACSLSINKQGVLTAAEATLKNSSSFPFNVSLSKAEGVSYVSHPTTSVPWADNSGGVIVNLKGSAKGQDLASFFAGAIGGIVAAFVSGNPLLLLFGFEVHIRDVNFAATVAERIDVNSQGILTATVANETSSASNAGDCGFNIGDIFSSGAIGICLSGNVQSAVDSQAKDTSSTNAMLANAFTTPIPTNLTQTVINPNTCPTFQTCSAATDCVGSGSAGAELAGLFGLVPKASIGLDNNTPGLVTGLNADRTVPGLNADGTGTSSDVWPQAKAQLTAASNWTCGQAAAPTSGAPSPVPEGCSMPSGKVCEYNLRARRVNHYADSMEVVWYDELDKVIVNAQDLASVAVGALVSVAKPSGGTAPCSVTTAQFTDVSRTSPDVVKTSGF